MSAEWSAAPSNPPANNTAAPINVSSSTQAKLGNLMANIMSAANSTWSPEYCDELGNNCTDISAVIGAANPISTARNAGYPVSAVPAGITPEWPAAIVCEQGGSPVVLYAHGIGVSGDGFRYRDLSGTRRYDFNANGTYSGRAEVMGGCSVHAANANLQGICAAGLCMGATAS